jgi:hypothetical protein
LKRMMIGLVVRIWETSKSPHQKKKKEDVEGLLVDYALKKGRYVGTRASAQSMRVSSPTTKQTNSKGVRSWQIKFLIYPLKVGHFSTYSGSFGTL